MVFKEFVCQKERFLTRQKKLFILLHVLTTRTMISYVGVKLELKKSCKIGHCYRTQNSHFCVNSSLECCRLNSTRLHQSLQCCSFYCYSFWCHSFLMHKLLNVTNFSRVFGFRHLNFLLLQTCWLLLWKIKKL